MNYDNEAVIRILPDANEENQDIFFIEKSDHFLTINGERKKIACVSMYGEDCPICDRSKKYYKANDAVTGRAYYKNKTFFLKALVLKDPLPEGDEGSYVGKMVTISATKGLLDIINSEIAKLQDDEDPFSLTDGLNFTIKKSKKITPDGDKADYVGSGFARKATSLPQEIINEITLVDLSTMLPKNPGLDKVVAFLEAHDSGNSIDENADEKSESFDTEIPMDRTEKTVIPALIQEVVKTEIVEKVESPVQEVKSETSEDDDLMKMILNRNKSKK